MPRSKSRADIVRGDLVSVAARSRQYRQRLTVGVFRNSFHLARKEKGSGTDGRARFWWDLPLEPLFDLFCRKSGHAR